MDKEINILLINPLYPFIWQTETVDHLGLGYIANYARLKGYKNVEIFNFNMVGFSALLPKLEEFQPNYVGISVPFTKSYSNALKIAQMVKEVDPSTIVVMGGVHPSACPMEVIENEYVDYVVKGEGEIAFCLVLEGATETIVEAYPVEELDILPFPERPILNKNRIGIVTSRGCPFNCSFCSIHNVWGKRWRARSPENVVEEIKSLNVSSISFEDDNLTLSRERAERLFLLMEKECKVKWNTPNGIYVNTLDWDLLKLMKSSGCYALSLAIESGDDFVRNQVIGKNLKREKIKEVVENCRDLGILTMGFFVIGMPLEDINSMQESLEFSKELMLDAINVSIATPYPNSQLYKNCVDNNYLTISDYTAFNEKESCLIETPYLKAEEVKNFRHYFVDEFNRYHNEHSLINTENKHMMIRNPML